MELIAENGHFANQTSLLPGCFQRTKARLKPINLLLDTTQSPVDNQKDSGMAQKNQVNQVEVVHGLPLNVVKLFQPKQFASG